MVEAIADGNDYARGISATALNEGSGPVIAGDFFVYQYGSGSHVGISSAVYANSGEARGITTFSQCQGGSLSDSYGGRLISRVIGSGTSYGLYSDAAVSQPGTGKSYGGYLTSVSTDTGWGLYSYCKSRDNHTYAGYFHADSSTTGSPRRRYGVFSKADNNSANWNTYGIYADANGGATCYGIYAEASGGAANNYAGYFLGNVNVTGTLSKGAGAFKIDHPLDPENKYLYHSFVESPDMKNIYDGMAALDASGLAVVTLPDWFEALNNEFRYQLTAIGAASPNLHVASKISGNRFIIAGGEPGLEVSWQVTGIRKDAFANAHRIPVEEEKPRAEKGKYLYPEEMRKERELGVDYYHAGKLNEGKDDGQ